jgi:diguanylate cyclase (GGDEF)-like protein/PAS domain S-box-containing protein
MNLKHVLDAITCLSPSALSLKTPDGRYALANPNLQRIHSLSEREIVGKTDFDLYPTEIATAFRRNDELVLSTMKRHSIEELFPVNGELRTFMSHTFPVKDETGAAAFVCRISLDITEQKRTTHELKLSNQRFFNLFHSSPIPQILSLRDTGVIKEANLAFHSLFGYEQGEVVDRTMVALGLIPESTEKVATQESFRAIHPTRNNELQVRRSSGERITVLESTETLELDGQSYVLGTMIDITLRKLAEEQIEQLAYYDQLTELPNRRLFRDRLEQDLKRAQRNDGRMALIFLDLDHFKEINDTLGHDKGDILLVETARRIGAHVRDTDTIARLGGDEFAIAMSEYGDISNINRVVQGVLQELKVQFDLGAGNSGTISCSVGIALFPQDAANFDDLLKCADQAMYAAKHSGRDTFNYFTRSMQEGMAIKLALTNDLRRALELNQLELYFQPIMDAASGKIFKAEALLRWNHPVRGMLSPAVFIPLAEESGLILEIGEWVFMQAIRTIQSWEHRTGRLIPVGVNKSPLQFTRAERHPWLEMYRESGLPPNSIVVEITEGLLLEKSDKVRRELQYFQANGIEIAIDDFGTGFSSLAYLNRFQINYLKIDRSFVNEVATNQSSLALTEAIVVMAHKLGIPTIAEGVETEEQRDILCRLGCDYLQGYLFSKPVPAGDFEKLLVD